VYKGSFRKYMNFCFQWLSGSRDYVLDESRRMPAKYLQVLHNLLIFVLPGYQIRTSVHLFLEADRK
jgi:hypothetical protein